MLGVSVRASASAGAVTACGCTWSCRQTASAGRVLCRSRR